VHDRPLGRRHPHTPVCAPINSPLMIVNPACAGGGAGGETLDELEGYARSMFAGVVASPTGATAKQSHVVGPGAGAASVASFVASVLTEMYLCNVCSCQRILRRNGRG
jgi:hypothetical protein